MPRQQRTTTLAPDLDFSRIVRDLRTRKGLTQEQLARKLDVTFATVNGWENGRHRPTPSLASRVLKLARAAGTHGETSREASPRVEHTAEGVRPVLPATGWPRSDAERRDFYHRIREFPPELRPWRRELVEWVRTRSPWGQAPRTADEVRQAVDDGISHIREVAEILSVVHRNPDLGNKSDPLDELVYIILSRKTPDAAYRRLFDALKGRFPTWDALLRARRKTVADLLNSGGLAQKKTESLFEALLRIRERFGSCSLDEARAWTDADLESFLCSLPEVSRKSAYCVMMFAFQRSVFPVDTHVGRVLQRIGIHQGIGLRLEGLDHKQLQAELPRFVPPNLRRTLHVNLVAHGREVCTARRPACERCDLKKLCLTFRRSVQDAAVASDAPVAVDLFCGAGGLSHGLERAGFRVALAADSDDVSIRTFRVNHPAIGDAAVTRKVEDLSVAEVRRLLGSRRLDLLAGAPPCQGFSGVGNRSKRTLHGMRREVHADERNYLFQAFIRLAIELKPRLVLMENVPGMETAQLQGKSFADLAREMLEAGGYRTTIWKLDAASFGVPQERRRIFLVGSSGKLLPERPRPDYQAPSEREFDPDGLPPVTLGEAIYDLPELGAGEGASVMGWGSPPVADRRGRRYLDKFGIRNSPQVIFNHTVRYHNDRDLELYSLLQQGEDSYHVLEKGRKDLMRYRSEVFDDKYMRLRSDWPSKTIVAHLRADGNGYVHPFQNRSISFREAARLQSFPDDFMFCGSPSDQWNQLGNAVPPVLAEAIGTNLRAFLESTRR